MSISKLKCYWEEKLQKFDYSSIRLEITSRCNLFCKYCHDAQYLGRNDDLTTEEIKKLIYNLNKHHKLKKVLLTGGEPLTKSDILDIVRFVTSLDIKCDMVTNGSLLNKSLILQLAEAGLKRLRISIDSPKGFDSLRMVNTDYLWQMIKYAKDNTDINTCIHTVFTSMNYNNLDAIFDKIIKLKIDRWRVFLLGYQGNAVTNNIAGDFSYYKMYVEATLPIVHRYISNQYKEILDLELEGLFKTNWLKMGKLANDMKIRDLYLNLHPCHYIHYQGTIRSNGVLTKCQYKHSPIVDFRKYQFDVEKAYTNFIPSSFDLLTLKDLEECKTCKYRLLCMGVCRARAKHLMSNDYKQDPISCYLKKVFFDKIFPLLQEENKEAILSFVVDGKDPRINCCELSHEKGWI